jgi:starvation-inducible outer membrane lipoprotein
MGARILANQQGFLMPEINSSRILGMAFRASKQASGKIDAR